MSSDVLHFEMERYDDEDGVYFVITGVEIALVTDGETIEKAIRNLREAVELHFDDDPEPIPTLEVTFIVTEDYG